MRQDSSRSVVGRRLELMPRSAWATSGSVGVTAGVAMGLLLTAISPATLESTLPSLVGLSGLAVGWTLHLAHSVLFGLVFAVLVLEIQHRRGQLDLRQLLIVGITYSLGLWAVASVVLPLWLWILGTAAIGPAPSFDAAIGAGHLVYGVVLGLLAPLYTRR